MATMLVPLSYNRKFSDSFFAIVDDFDYGMVMEHRWCLDIRKRVTYAKTTIYSRNNKKGRIVYLHRFVMYEPMYEIDHRDHNGLNCSHLNLRICSREENMGNTRKRSDSTNPYKGIILQKENNKWVARLNFQKKYYHLGTFNTPEEAAKAYDEKLMELRGSFAMTNF